MPSVQKKAWCFTLNNYTDNDEQYLAACTTRGCTYLIYGREVGESGTPHLQGYIEMATKSTRGRVGGVIGARAHLEPRRGSQSQAIDYCKKDGDFVEFGSPCQQGKRTDLEGYVARLKGGESLRDLALEDPVTFCRYKNGLERIAHWLGDDVPREPPKCYFIWGEPGTGKSRWAHDVDPDSTWIYGGAGWFDGYSGQRVAIFDDFDDDNQRGGIGYGLFLKLLDRYKLSVPIKGGFVNWRPEIIIFTANRSLDEFYFTNTGYNGNAVRRRFHHVQRVSNLGELDGLRIN